MNNLENIKNECLNCQRCTLYQNRTNCVFSDGNINAKVMIIGEAPGENEDLQGKPFVGIAGKLLNKYLSLAGLSREKDIYITNIVKCRPPKNRKPKSSEKQACLNFLLKQIEIISPKIIILCGGTALETFIKNKKMAEVHGKTLELNINNQIYNAIPIYHPSPLCRVKNKQEITVEDLTKIFQFLK
jgi:DNA polymerase